MTWFAEPSRGPRDVKVERLNGTAMNVSFTPLNIAEARSLRTTYTVTYSPVSSKKRQAREVQVPENQIHVLVNDLDPGTSYDVQVSAANLIGDSVFSESQIARAPSSGIYIRIIIHVHTQ